MERTAESILSPSSSESLLLYSHTIFFLGGAVGAATGFLGCCSNADEVSWGFCCGIWVAQVLSTGGGGGGGGMGEFGMVDGGCFFAVARRKTVDVSSSSEQLLSSSRKCNRRFVPVVSFCCVATADDRSLAIRIFCWDDTGGPFSSSSSLEVVVDCCLVGATTALSCARRSRSRSLCSFLICCRFRLRL